MRAALPHTEGFVDRDGIKLHYEIFGAGEHIVSGSTYTHILVGDIRTQSRLIAR